MENIIYKIESGVAHITLNRPDKLNSFNRQMSLEPIDALEQCEQNDEIRTVLLDLLS